MTATQYLKRKQRLYEWGYWISVWAILLTLLGTITIILHAHHPRDLPLTPQSLLIRLMVPPMIVAILFFWSTQRLHRNFVKNHPEMEYICEWMKMGESAENYPTEENRLQAEERIPRILLGHALAADTVFQMRDRLITGAWEDKYEYYRVFNDLNDRAKILNEKYIAYWTLVIDKMRTIPAPAADPRKFRESKRWSMYF